MNLPRVVHPTTFSIGAHRLQVVTHFAVTEKQAALIATYFHRQRRWLKKDQGKTIQVLWAGDRAALAALEEMAERAADTLQSLLGPRAGFRPRRR